MRRKLVQVFSTVSCLAFLVTAIDTAYGQFSPQVLDSTMRITTLLPSTYRPKDSSLVAFVDNDTCFYYETPPTYYLAGQNKNWYWESGTYLISKAGTANYGRRTPKGIAVSALRRARRRRGPRMQQSGGRSRSDSAVEQDLSGVG
jgi:hypothetical protein